MSESAVEAGSEGWATQNANSMDSDKGFVKMGMTRVVKVNANVHPAKESFALGQISARLLAHGLWALT